MKYILRNVGASIYNLQGALLTLKSALVFVSEELRQVV